MKIAVAVVGLDETHRSRLLSALAGHDVRFLSEAADAPARRRCVADAEIVFGNVPPAWLETAPALRWVQLDSAGAFPYLQLASPDRRPPVLVASLKNFYGEAVAEGLLAGVLALCRQLPRLLAAQALGRWVKPEVEQSIRTLHGSRVVILGAGAIGCAVGSILSGFRCRVDYFGRTAAIARLRSTADLDRELPEVDLLINVLPQTPATDGLLDRARLERLPRRAIFANGGRGSVVDEKALAEMLADGRLAGAVLDVTQVEPLPVGHPFWALPTVVLTQHTGGRFTGETEGKIARFLENRERFSRGERLIGALDSVLGY